MAFYGKSRCVIIHRRETRDHSITYMQLKVKCTFEGRRLSTNFSSVAKLGAKWWLQALGLFNTVRDSVGLKLAELISGKMGGVS